MKHQKNRNQLRKVALGVACVLMVTLLWLDEWFPGWVSWEKQFFSYPILLSIAGFLLIPLLYLHWFELRDNMHSLNWKPLIVALKSFAIVGPATALSFVPIMFLGYSFRSWPGGIWIAFFQFSTLPALVWYLRDMDDGELMRPPKPEHIGVGVVTGLLLLAIFHPFSIIAERAILALFAIGFAEECFFRGFLQTQLNTWWSKSINFMGCRLGLGWVIASLLFGLMHFFSPSAPFNLPWAIWTFAGGLQFGLIARIGGSFLSSAMVHGPLMIYPVVSSYL